ncbi:MAG TPA: DUF177 domain-containing protein [Qipengyuania sp.]|nr:DUF177 domain-containing protein [Qipengyuania sp.]
MSAGEFEHIIKLDRLPAELSIEADAVERVALARRFGLPAVHALRASVSLSQDGDSVEARGRLRARFDQRCAIADEPFANSIDEPLAIRFVRAIAPGSEEDAIEFASDDADEIEYDGASFDLGEAVAQSFGLALDVYATGPDAETARRAGGIVDEDAPSGPFAALAALNPKR